MGQKYEAQNFKRKIMMDEHMVNDAWGQMREVLDREMPEKNADASCLFLVDDGRGGGSLARTDGWFRLVATRPNGT